jgi:hypothetical protein
LFLPKADGPGGTAREVRQGTIAARRYRYTTEKGRLNMHVDFFVLPPLIALVSGIAILIWPRLLNYIVAAYLILIGLIGLGVRF